MNHQEVAEVLSSIEEQIDVNSFWVDGIQIWPLLRRDIWMYLLEQDGIPEPNSESSGSKIYASGNEYLDGRYRFRDDRNIYFSRRLKKELSVLLERKDILLWSRKEDHTEIFSNGVIDRIIDPMLWFVRDQGFTAIKISRSSGVSWQGVKQLETSIKLPIDLFHEHHAGRETRGSVQKLITEISKILPDLPITQSHIISLVRRLNSRVDYFDIVLDVVRPKLVILGVFYSPDALALIHACRKKKIPTVDVQHGKQGLYHAMYSGWSALPVNGYSVLPDYFWTWGRESARLIQQNQSRNVMRPKPVTGGNRWLSIWKKTSEPLVLSSETSALLKEIKCFKRVILVTLQPLEDPFPSFFLKAMQQSSPEWYWIIRTHPHQRREIDTIEKCVRSTGVRSFDVRRASNSPLYPLLKRADVHITRWSSVAFEALALEKQTILVDKTGLKLYGSYINQGLFKYAATTHELMEALSALPGKSPQPETEPYIETGDGLALTALKKCLEKQWVKNYIGNLWFVVNHRFQAVLREVCV